MKKESPLSCHGGGLRPFILKVMPLLHIKDKSFEIYALQESKDHRTRCTKQCKSIIVQEVTVGPFRNDSLDIFPRKVQGIYPSQSPMFFPKGVTNAKEIILEDYLRAPLRMLAL